MRPVIFAALLGASLSVNPVGAQSAGEQPPSRAPESKKRGSISPAIAALSESGPERANALAEANREGALLQKQTETEGGNSTKTAAPPPLPLAAALPTVQAVPPGPPQKNLTGEEFKLVRVGSSAKEVLAVLGPPSSRIVVPDDDGHLREALQYWVKGSPMGTVRLDNGRVVQIEINVK